MTVADPTLSSSHQAAVHGVPIASDPQPPPSPGLVRRPQPTTARQQLPPYLPSPIIPSDRPPPPSQIRRKERMGRAGPERTSKLKPAIQCRPHALPAGKLWSIAVGSAPAALPPRNAPDIRSIASTASANRQIRALAPSKEQARLQW